MICIKYFRGAEITTVLKSLDNVILGVYLLGIYTRYS